MNPTQKTLNELITEVCCVDDRREQKYPRKPDGKNIYADIYDQGASAVSAPLVEALKKMGEFLIEFPEGTRGREIYDECKAILTAALEKGNGE
jgi:1-acyl-sn-glycerol-3-phosphate acyltransferase